MRKPEDVLDVEVVPISKGGQISIPARIRKRWGVARLLVRDEGDRVVILPMPDDPIAAAAGSLAGPGPTSDEMREMDRREAAEIEERKWHELHEGP